MGPARLGAPFHVHGMAFNVLAYGRKRWLLRQLPSRLNCHWLLRSSRVVAFIMEPYQQCSSLIELGLLSEYIAKMSGKCQC